MKVIRFLVCLLCFYSVRYVSAQKPVLDSAAYVNWPSVNKPDISNDGKYIVYAISNKPVGNKTLVLISADLKWKREFIGSDRAGITSDSKFAVLRKGKDSLVILLLGTDSIKYISSVNSFGIAGEEEKQWLFYTNINPENELILRDLKTGQEHIYQDVSDKWLSKDGKTLVLKRTASDGTQSLIWADVNSGKSNKIWEGKEAGNIVFDSENNQLAFKAGAEVWHYKYGALSAEILVSRNSTVLLTDRAIENINGFSRNGRILYFTVVETESPGDTNGTVEVWSYRDIKLQSEQETETGRRSILSAVDLTDHKTFHLQEKYDFINNNNVIAKREPGFMLASNRINGLPGWINAKTSWSLTDTKTGNRTSLSFLEKRNIVNYLVRLSPDEKFIIFFDTDANDFFTYELKTKTIRNITGGIPVSWTQLNWSDDGMVRPRGIAGWMDNNKSVLLYDKNDIWKIDLFNKEKPVNLTNGYGLKNDLVFSLALSEYTEKSIAGDEELILNAFNIKNKNNGFFSKKTGVIGDPALLTMGPYIYQLIDNPNVTYDYTVYPCKAKEAKTYVVRRTSATESPNYFITKDFRTFNKITDLQPEKKYNWCTTELHTWKSLDGRSLQGILYKPENFDPNKKYPVIFYYYERLSDRLNTSLIPDFSEGPINIPTYVSNGYLVFTPDIYYAIGDPFQGTYDAVISAAQYVSTFSFVNAQKMGIQGHSFGGVQTNYLVTHTDMFAAACAASGVTDLVSAYGSIMGGVGRLQGPSVQDYYERSGEQGRMGGTLWEKPEAYIKNSPVFYADKVTTPLLMMHTKKDDLCLYSNAMEFFTGLRRMGKRVWMLVYSEGGHSVNGKEAEDYTVRMMQFFDHYLKDKPAPLWMLNGIPAARRGIDDGLTLDATGRTPGRGLLSEEEKRKVDSLMSQPMTIILK